MGYHINYFLYITNINKKYSTERSRLVILPCTRRVDKTSREIFYSHIHLFNRDNAEGGSYAIPQTTRQIHSIYLKGTEEHQTTNLINRNT